jgi:D-threo-aldose 1-dehydrogenase
VIVDPHERARLGKSDVWVPYLGLGTAPLGGWPTAVSYEQGTATVVRAWERGIRYFDTAPFYGFGNSERLLGRGLSGIQRDEFILSTKVGRLLVPGQTKDPLYQNAPPLTPVFNFSPDAILRSLEESRGRLGFERIDIALIHDPEAHHDEALDAAYPTLDRLRAEGVIGAVGVGMNWTEPLTRFAKEAAFDCFLEAGRYTLLDNAALDDLFPACEEHGVSIIAGGVYNSGILADPRPGAHFDYLEADPGLVERALRLKSVCEEFSVPLRAAAIQFPMAHPAVATVIVGARTPDEVDDNLAMFSFEIPGELWVALKDRGLLREDAPTPAS